MPAVRMPLILLDLPSELIETIAAATDDRDLLALRMICREISRNIDKIFVERYFTHRRHLVTRVSLQALLDISKSRRLRRKLKSIELVVTNLSSSIRKPSSEHDPKSNEAHISKSAKLSQQSVWSLWHPEAEEELHGRADVAMLTETLANLKEAAVVPKLRVDTQTHFSSRPYGFRQLVRYLSSTNQTRNTSEYMLLGRLPDDEGETAAILLTAVTKAQFPAQSLNLCGKQTPLHHESLTRMTDSVMQLQCTMSQLKKLALTIGCVHKMNVQDIKTLGSLMRAAPILEVLELEFITGCCGARKSLIPPIVLAALRTNAVRTLRITGAVLRQQDLCATIYHHKKSLRALDLRHISIMPQDSFTAVFDWMQQQFSIDALTLHWLQQGYDHMDEATGRGAEYTFDDREGVKVGLRQLSRSATFGDPPIPHAKLLDQKSAV